jgi:protein-L-isoaspartate O-methyltransferase
MVIPVAQDAHHKMVRITKQQDGALSEEYFSDFSFVPMLPGTQGKG